MHHNLEDQVDRIANEYFSLLARSFPVMCASDEFHFLPRVQEAAQYLERVDDLSEEAVLSATESVRNFRTQLLCLPEPHHLEKELDRQLLLHNMAGFLLELEEVQSWRHNPLLYLKIACIGLDHALNKPSGSLKERVERTTERLIGLSRLLGHGSPCHPGGRGRGGGWGHGAGHQWGVCHGWTGCLRYLDQQSGC